MVAFSHDSLCVVLERLIVDERPEHNRFVTTRGDDEKRQRGAPKPARRRRWGRCFPPRTPASPPVDKPASRHLGEKQTCTIAAELEGLCHILRELADVRGRQQLDVLRQRARAM